jgi:2,4-dienoyl-CoA reductase-like NADH-dependent reductase (Old Yellow Enzyme family)
MAQLFTPFTMGGLTLPNRIVVSPMGQGSARDGIVNDWHLMHYGNMAISGAGLLVMEATAVQRDGRNAPGDPGLWSDAQAEAWERPVAFCRKYGGAKLGIQLWHAGRKGSVTIHWEHQRLIPLEKGGWEVAGASNVPYGNRRIPKALTEDDIAQLIADYVAAAKRVDALGLDLIEIHAAHGYLIHNFLSPLSNRRNDRYGGDLAGRMRLGLEIFDAVRAVWPERKPLGVRISATDWTDGGWTLDESVEFARELCARGCNYITASSGGLSPEQKLAVGPNYQVPFAERIRKEAGIATMAVGLITEAEQAEQILQEGRADLVCLGRGMLYNPRWPWHAAHHFGAEPFYPLQYERSHPSMRTADFLKPSRD